MGGARRATRRCRGGLFDRDLRGALAPRPATARASVVAGRRGGGAVIELRDVNPVPRDRFEGWASSSDGAAARDRAELAGPLATPRRRRIPAVAVAAALAAA